jgi:hypothetical protein
VSVHIPDVENTDVKGVVNIVEDSSEVAEVEPANDTESEDSVVGSAAVSVM